MPHSVNTAFDVCKMQLISIDKEEEYASSLFLFNCYIDNLLKVPLAGHLTNNLSSCGSIGSVPIGTDLVCIVLCQWSTTNHYL